MRIQDVAQIFTPRLGRCCQWPLSPWPTPQSRAPLLSDLTCETELVGLRLKGMSTDLEAFVVEQPNSESWSRLVECQAGASKSE